MPFLLSSIDFLVEDADNVRQGQQNLHDLIREKVAYGQVGERIDGANACCLSGHIAPFNTTSRDEAYLLLLDAFPERVSLESLLLKQQGIIKQLYAERIIPLSANGHIIR